MGETVIIPLKTPLVAPEGQVRRVVLREPTFDEFLVHGDPYTVAASKDDTRFVVENLDVIAAYLRICVVEPVNPETLRQGGARLAREMKEAMLGFFRPDAGGEDNTAAASADSGSSPTSSSSAASDAPSTTSSG